MAPTFLLLYTITNEKTVKLTQIDRILAASRAFPAETYSNNYGLTLLKSHIPHLGYDTSGQWAIELRRSTAPGLGVDKVESD